MTSYHALHHLIFHHVTCMFRFEMIRGNDCKRYPIIAPQWGSAGPALRITPKRTKKQNELFLHSGYVLCHLTINAL